jgi:imidazolonepropionase-like amidohydrolase
MRRSASRSFAAALSAAFTVAGALPAALEAQQTSRTEPVTGLRDNPVRVHALTGGRVVVAPGRAIDNATVVIRDGLVEAVGAGLQPPAGARVWDLGGHTIYPGFIDAHADLGMDDAPEDGDVGPTHWNPQVRAWFSTASRLQDDEDRRSSLRSLGFGTALAVPRLGIFRGQAAVIDLGDGNVRSRIVRPNLVQSVSFSRDQDLGGLYPGSPMGAIALMRQTLLDADWYQRAWAAYESSGRAFLPPETSEALASLDAAVRGGQPMLFEAEREEEHLRVRALAEEFPIVPWVRGNGHEYKLLDVLAGSDVPLIVPIAFPDAPDVSTPERALDVSLAELRHWYLAPENPARLASAGIEFAITSDGLANDTDFLENLRAAVARGLSQDDALAALTTVPARLLGIDRTHGTLDRGKVANLVVVEGDLFHDQGLIRDVWVEGERYGVSIAPRIDPRGTWRIADAGVIGEEARLELRGSPARQARHARPDRRAPALRRVRRRQRDGQRHRARGPGRRRADHRQHLDVPPARRRADDRARDARLGQPDRRAEPAREAALGRAARAAQVRGRAAHGEVRARREPEAPPGPLPRHAHGHEQIIRDHFLAAREYERAWQEWERTPPGRAAAPRPAHGGARGHPERRHPRQSHATGRTRC